MNQRCQHMSTQLTSPQRCVLSQGHRSQHRYTPQKKASSVEHVSVSVPKALLNTQRDALTFLRRLRDERSITYQLLVDERERLSRTLRVAQDRLAQINRVIELMEETGKPV